MLCTLYLTTACELCDEALAFLLDTGILHGHILETVDIALDESLFKSMATRIPVLKINQSELGWPFDEDQLRQILQTK